MIPSTELEKLKEKRLVILKNLLKTRRERESAMKKIEKNEFNNASNGLETIESVKDFTPINGTQTGLTLRQSELVETSDLVGSQSMKLIDDSALHLCGLVKSARHVEDACQAATTMARLIALKLEIKKQSRGTR